MRETIRPGGRRGILGGHYGSRRKDEKNKDCVYCNEKTVEAQLDELVKKETDVELEEHLQPKGSRKIIFVTPMIAAVTCTSSGEITLHA